ncbi:MAG: 4-hydroxybenzoate octaprenyltransferase [Alphaproteobacteria bacterium]
MTQTKPHESTADRAKDASDIRPMSWMQELLPKPLKPYGLLARLDRPIGTWLLLLPCWWGLTLAWADFFADGSGPHPALPFPPLLFLLLFAAGALVMRGAGCTWNDITDRDFDGRVARTALRPIPAGDVSLRQAYIFLILQLLTGLLVLVQFNPTTIVIGASALALVAAYPFMKRITYWPQAWLGLTFNWGVLVGWASLHASLHPQALVLYVAGIFWTLGYDTIYAHQDKEDDALIGVKSTALRFGDASRLWIGGFYTMTLVLIGISGFMANLGIGFWVGFAAAAGHLIWQVKTVDFDKAENCMRRFKSNRDFGFIVVAALIAGAATYAG